ncbi:MAG TPA: aminodeoxychorismate lyase, partial [Cyclobacteriaceae bacterium]|nr:aminodeoxychorismate lyase [Cyclobacteriaceae bacterium]
MFKGKLKLIVFLVLSVLMISFTYYAYQICYTPNILVGKENRVIVIPDSADFKKVQEILHEGDYVQDLLSFSFLAKLMDYDKAVKSGRYTL